MTPEELARVKIDKQLNDAGWDIVSRNEYVPQSTAAVKEGLMQGNKESDYLLFIDDKAIAIVEAKPKLIALVKLLQNRPSGILSILKNGTVYGSRVSFLLFILLTEIKSISRIC